MIKLITNQLLLFNDISLGTTEECLDWCKNQQEIEVDTETIKSYLEGGLFTLQLGNKDTQFVIDCTTIDVRLFKHVLEDPNKVKLFWNAKYDMKYFLYFGIHVTNVYDGFLAECILTTGYEDRELSLGACAKSYVGVELDKSIRGILHKEGLTNRVIKYAAEDVMYLGEIKKKQMEKIIQEELEMTLELENKFVEVLAEIEYKGFKIDQIKWLEIEGENKRRLDNQLIVLDQWILDNNIVEYIDNQMDLFSTQKRAKTRIQRGKKVKHLFSSAKDTIKFLKHLGVDTKVVDKKTKKEKDSCEAKHIKKFINQCSFIKPYIAYKEIDKLISTYGKKFLKNLSKVDNRLHSEFWQILDTGRVSSTKPNIQNIPSRGDYGPKLRACFVPEEGNILVINDYSAQEPRVTADKCEDENLINFFLTGDGDIHSMVASKMFTVIEGKEMVVTKSDKKRRDVGKILGLKMDYGGSAYTIKDELGVSEEEAQKFVDAYFNAFPKKRQLFDKAANKLKEKGYLIIDNVTKRRWYADFWNYWKELDNKRPDLEKSDWKVYYILKGKLERNASNYPTQGTSASMSKLAAIRIHREFRKRGWDFIKDAGIVNIVHDEIVTECRVEISEEVAKITQEKMEEAGRVFCPRVPMEAHSDIAPYWRK